MRKFVSKLQTFMTVEGTGREPAIKQGIFHVVAVYCIAWVCLPTLTTLVYGSLLHLFGGHRLGGNPFQFTFSHVLILSIMTGLVGGFVNARLLDRGIVRFVWLVPFLVLLYRFVFHAPGVYPTMPWDSDFGKAFHYYFGGGFRIVGEWHTRQQLRILIGKNMNDILRGYSQYCWTAPAYVGAAYSIGASLSLLLNRRRSQLSADQSLVANATSEG